MAWRGGRRFNRFHPSKSLDLFSITYTTGVRGISGIYAYNPKVMVVVLFIVAGYAIRDKIEKKKEAKRQKKAWDEKRYRELQVETSQRLARTQSGNVIENNFDEEEEGDEDMEEAAASSVAEEGMPKSPVGTPLRRRRMRMLLLLGSGRRRSGRHRCRGGGRVLRVRGVGV